MDWLQWSSSIIGSLAWPVAAVFIAFIFRAQIGALLKRIKEASWGDKSVSFADELDKIEKSTPELDEAADNTLEPSTPQLDDRYQKLLAIAPNAAIIEAWGEVEEAIRKAAKLHGIVTSDPNNMTADRLAVGLATKRHLTVDAMKMILEMRMLRNRAAHNEKVTTADAFRFSDLAMKVKNVIFV